jgi:hypothetical protein
MKMGHISLRYVWGKTIESMLDDNDYLPIDQARKLIAMIEERPLPESADRQQLREQLLTMLRRSIELNEPLTFIDNWIYAGRAHEDYTLAELFRLDPLEYHKQDLKRIITYYQTRMAKLETASKEIGETTEVSRKKQHKQPTSE